jgi:thioredoxin reductase
MRHDWNSLLCHDDDFRLKSYDKTFFPHADNLVRYIKDYVERFDINMQYSFNIETITKKDGLYCIRDNNGNEHCCEVLIVATGLYKPFIPQIEGIEHTTNYSDMSLNIEEFENKRVLVIGKKNSAFETAEHLISAASMIHLVSPSSIKMAWKTHYVGDLRAINNNFLDTYQLKSQNAVLDADITLIKKEGEQYRVTFSYKHAEDEIEEIVYDRILCCTGFKFDNSIFSENNTPELAHMGKFPALTTSFESVNNLNMYFAGTLTHSLDYRKSTSGFIHGFRYNSKALADILIEKHLGENIPTIVVSNDSKELTNLMLDRINRSGALWQQPGFIADAALKNHEGYAYIKELPKEHFIEKFASSSDDIYILTLEYGASILGDPFAVQRNHRENTTVAEASQFLHPVVRRYVNGILVARHDVIEDLEARWVEPEHFEPMIKFFDEQKDAISCEPLTNELANSMNRIQQYECEKSQA